MTARKPLAVGTRVYHVSQEWARGGPGTASIVKAAGPYSDGSFEYEVLASVDFSRQTGPANPETRLTWWSSFATAPAPTACCDLPSAAPCEQDDCPGSRKEARP